MSSRQGDLSRFITARALIGRGEKRMEAAFNADGSVVLSLDAYAEIAQEFHHNKDLVDEIRMLVNEP
ncbi:hypothetical protein SEA_PUREGLOBE5_85 [Arthrobacter phage Pureglobe5]|nr:hypothetical protein PBI_BEAGLE_87 [Arthrobacter phage Beagle]UYL87448.1 hypothetical protein SEA_PUREGLOBE5_85 [Arthrobacter phage Pureglobe5]